MNGRTFKVICENRKLATSMLVSSDSQPDSVFTNNNNNNNNNNDDIEDDENDLDNKNSDNPKIHSVIEFVTGALLTDLNVENTNASQMEPDLIEEREKRSDCINERICKLI